MTVFEPVRAARLAWERTQPQLFIEIPEPCRGDHKHTEAAAGASRSVSSPSATSPGGRRPTASTPQRTTPCP